MAGLFMMLLVGGAAMLAIGAIYATIAPKLDLIVMLLRDGPQPFVTTPEPEPGRAQPRVIRRAATRPASGLVSAAPLWREAA